MRSLAVLRGVDAVTVPVPDLDQGLEFYRDQLGHELVWRNDAVGQAGLRLPESQAELVLSIGYLVPELERGLEMPLGVCKSVRGFRLEASLYRSGQGAGRLVSPHPVISKPRCACAEIGIAGLRVFGERLGESGVQLGALARQQIAVERLLRQGMPEGVRLRGGVWNQYLMRDGFAESC